eukprot:954147-Rhodomonas_salina.1
MTRGKYAATASSPDVTTAKCHGSSRTSMYPCSPAWHKKASLDRIGGYSRSVGYENATWVKI